MPATLDQFRWRKFPVLDDGFVCLVDVLGDDHAVVEAARVSYAAGTRHVSDDRTLIRYLMRHQHTTPFEMAEVKLLVRVPMDCWRQWIRHRTASINETSTRYSIAIDASQATRPTSGACRRPTTGKGARGCSILRGARSFRLPRPTCSSVRGTCTSSDWSWASPANRRARPAALDVYRGVLEDRLAQSVAFLGIADGRPAQWEIRQYAATIGREIVQPLFPLVWEAFVDYRQEALHLSRLDREVVARLAAAGRLPATAEDFLAAGDPAWAGLERCRSATSAAKSWSDWGCSVSHSRKSCYRLRHTERREPSGGVRVPPGSTRSRGSLPLHEDAANVGKSLGLSDENHISKDRNTQRAGRLSGLALQTSICYTPAPYLLAGGDGLVRFLFVPGETGYVRKMDVPFGGGDRDFCRLVGVVPSRTAVDGLRDV